MKVCTPWQQLLPSAFLLSTCYYFRRLAAQPLRNRRFELRNRRQQTGGQEPKELIPAHRTAQKNEEHD
jgi:hypothetical protein